MRTNPMLLCDAYKISHVFQYPRGTQYVYSNLTPRKSRLPWSDEMVFFGLQYFCLEYLLKRFNEDFFHRRHNDVLDEYRRRVRTSVGDLPSYDHITELHDLGYLPIRIKAVPEGTPVPMRVPCLTIVNTEPEFYWLTNFFETMMSACLWQACTSASIAHAYRCILDGAAAGTGMPPEFVQWQGHDFSMRGMSSIESGILSGMAHLLSFTGTDSIPAIDGLEQYYGADAEKELIAGSVPATEHSVMCAGSQECELETFQRLLNLYPKGILSVVSDTWDLWRVLTEHLPALKEQIMARDGKLVVRPDSGNPVDILCGDLNAKLGTPQHKGVVRLLWEVFGGTETSTGHKLLDSHVGTIYGDSITVQRAVQICTRLKVNGFASQVVFGIGSYTYQANTRDTYGTAIKATHCVINGEPRSIFKSPITDDGTKKSATGLLRVERVGGKLVCMEDVTPEQERGGLLEDVFVNGELVRRHTLMDIRNRLEVERKRQAGMIS